MDPSMTVYETRRANGLTERYAGRNRCLDMAAKALDNTLRL